MKLYPFFGFIVILSCTTQCTCKKGFRRNQTSTESVQILKHNVSIDLLNQLDQLGGHNPQCNTDDLTKCVEQNIIRGLEKLKKDEAHYRKSTDDDEDDSIILKESIKTIDEEKTIAQKKNVVEVEDTMENQNGDVDQKGNSNRDRDNLDTKFNVYLDRISPHFETSTDVRTTKENFKRFLNNAYKYTTLILEGEENKLAEVEETVQSNLSTTLTDAKERVTKIINFSENIAKKKPTPIMGAIVQFYTRLKTIKETFRNLDELMVPKYLEIFQKFDSAIKESLKDISYFKRELVKKVKLANNVCTDFSTIGRQIAELIQDATNEIKDCQKRGIKEISNISMDLQKNIKHIKKKIMETFKIAKLCKQDNQCKLKWESSTEVLKELNEGNLNDIQYEGIKNKLDIAFNKSDKSFQRVLDVFHNLKKKYSAKVKSCLQQ